MTAEASGTPHPLSGSAVPPWASQAQVAAATEALMATIDPKRFVGTRHHIVPKFILKRFANDREQVRVRYRDRRGHHVCNIKDLGVTDFYTFIGKAGELDSSYEQLWGVMEQGASAVLRKHLDNPFLKPHPFTLHDKQAVDALVALQSLRGPAMRRTGELIADYGVKFPNQDKMSAEEMMTWEFAPHQNDHLQVLAGLVEKVERHLSTRGAFLVTLDRPLLIICDEPVCLERPDSYVPPTRAQLRDYPRDILVDGEVLPENLIQFHNPRGVGLNNAEAIAMPVSPRQAIVYDKPGTAGPMRHLEIDGSDADDFTQELLQRCLEQAVLWIAGHPDHPQVANLRLPKTQPPIVIIDGGSPFARDARTNPRRAPRRLNKNARPESEVPTPI